MYQRVSMSHSTMHPLPVSIHTQRVKADEAMRASPNWRRGGNPEPPRPLDLTGVLAPGGGARAGAGQGGPEAGGKGGKGGGASRGRVYTDMLEAAVMAVIKVGWDVRTDRIVR